MKQSWSVKWKSSTQPRKQRKYRYNAPQHVRSRLMSGHLNKSLRSELKRRSVQLCKGDDVVVVKGQHKKKSGKISRIDRKNYKIYIDGIKVRKGSGQELEIAISPSNIVVTKVVMDDKKRIASLKRPAKVKAAAGGAK